MKLKTKTLVKALNQIDFDKKATKEPFTLLFLKTIENKLNLSHDFEDASINILIDCESASDIDVVIDIKEFTKLVKAIKSDIITLSIDNDKLKINNYLILIESYEEGVIANKYNLDYVKILEINSNQFISMLNQVKAGMSKDEDRFILRGININNIDNKLNLVSSDGYILMMASQEIDIKEINETIPDFIITRILKAFKGNELLTISISTNRTKLLKIESNNTTFINRLIDSEYPEYVKIFSALGDEIVKVNKKQLIEATQEALAMADWEHNKTIFDFQNNILEIKVIKQDEIKYSNKMIIEGLINVKIGFNAELLLRILNSIEDDIITLRIKDHLSPVKIEANKFITVIMPIRI